MDRNNTNFTTDLKDIKSKILKTLKKEKSPLHEHQYLVAKLVENYDILGSRGLLLYHEMSAGKTLTMVSIIVAIWDNNKILILANKSLHENFIKTFVLYTRLMFPKDEVMIRKFMKMVDTKVEFMTLNASNVGKKLEKRNLKGYAVIIEESHNFTRSVVGGGSKNALLIYNKLMKSDIKLFLLTGTPIVKNPFELVPIVNLLTTNKNLLPNDYDKFVNTFISSGQIIQRQILVDRLKGLVSYKHVDVEGSPRFPKVIGPIIKRIKMSKGMLKNYNDALRKDNEQISSDRMTGKRRPKPLQIPAGVASSFYVNSRIASIYAHTGIEYDKKGKKVPLIYTMNESSKMMEMVSIISKSPGIIAVYSDFNNKGLRPAIEYIKKHLDFRYYRSNDVKDFKNYAIHSGNESVRERKNLLDTLIENKNKDGKFIKVVFLSSTGAEGLDLKNIRTLIILNPQFVYQLTRQINARVARLDSHIALSKKNQNVTIYMLLSSISDSKQPDKDLSKEEEVYKNSLRKFKVVNEFNKLLQDVAIESNFLCARTNSRAYPTGDVFNAIGKPSPCKPFKSIKVTVNSFIIDDKTIYYDKKNNFYEKNITGKFNKITNKVLVRRYINVKK